jgi:hypothetical protein
MKIIVLFIFLGFGNLYGSAQKEISCVVSEDVCVVSDEIGNEDVKIKVVPADADVTKILSVEFERPIYYLPPQIFEIFVNLKTLDLYYLGIKEIRQNTFQNATKLEFFSLFGSKIINLYENMFQGAVNLKTLYTPCNRFLREVHENAFNGM